MELTGFKMLEGGRRGVKLSVREHIIKDGVTVIDDVERVRHIPLPMGLRGSVSGLKKVFMGIMMYWQPEFDVLWQDGRIVMFEGMDRLYERLVHLDQCVSVNGVKVVGNKFMIMGQVVTGNNGQVSAINTPLLGMDDSDYYDEAWDKILGVRKEMVEYLKSDKLEMDSRQYLLPLYDGKEGDLNGLSGEEMDRQAMELLEGKGYMVLSQSDVMGVEEGIEEGIESE